MSIRSALLPAITLFGSFGTLLCCALPATLVALGGGAVMIGLVSAVPQLVWISEHKLWIFIFAGGMLLVSGASQYLSRNAPCPIDAEQARACLRLRRLSRAILSISIFLYLVGAYFAFSPMLMQ